MKCIVMTQERYFYEENTDVSTINVELQSAALLSATAQIMMNTWDLVPGVTVLWSPQDSPHSIALEGVADGPCEPPIYFIASNYGDLSQQQIQQVVIQLAKLPGAVNGPQPQ